MTDLLRFLTPFAIPFFIFLGAIGRVNVNSLTPLISILYFLLDPISWVKPEEKPQNCIHEGVSRKLGEEWKQNDCITCVCNEDGTASCQTTMCKSCENAIPPDPGECCPHCPLPTNNSAGFDHHSDSESCETSLDDCKMKCYHGFRTDKNNCPICECADDWVRM